MFWLQITREITAHFLLVFFFLNLALISHVTLHMMRLYLYIYTYRLIQTHMQSIWYDFLYFTMLEQIFIYTRNSDHMAATSFNDLQKREPRNHVTALLHFLLQHF